MESLPKGKYGGPLQDTETKWPHNDQNVTVHIRFYAEMPNKHLVIEMDCLLWNQRIHLQTSLESVNQKEDHNC